LLLESHGVDRCLGCLELLELHEETCLRNSCLDGLIFHLDVWARDRCGLVFGWFHLYLFLKWSDYFILIWTINMILCKSFSDETCILLTTNIW
jgi:hypothetical protein